jgi:hypothetical protein
MSRNNRNQPAPRVARAVGALAAAAAAALLAAPASAADPAQLDCVTSPFQGAERGAAAQRAVQTARDGGFGTREVERVVEACRARYGWSVLRSQDALNYAISSLTAPLYGADLGRAGLDVDWLRREILSDRALIAAAAARDPRPPALQAFLVRVGPTLQRWAGQVAPADQERQFQLLADFIVSTAMAEGMRVAFASP